MRTGIFKPTVGNNGPVAGNRELQEMREAIIHCDGSPEMMKHLSGLLAQDLPALNEPASEFVLECVQNLPVKTPVYATLVAMLNHSSGEFVEEVVRATCEQLETTLASTSLDDRIKARLLLRFIAVWPVVGIVTASAAVDILDAVVCAAVDAADKGEAGWQPRADYLVYAVLAALPWGGAALQTAKEFDVMMDSIEDYLRKRRQGPDPAAMLFAPPAGSAADTVDDWLEECWGRVNEVRKAGAQDDASWSVKSIPPVTDIITGDSFELGGGAHHTPPPLKVAEMSFSGAAEALASYPVRPRLRCESIANRSILPNQFPNFSLEPGGKSRLRGDDSSFPYISLIP
jgi:nuclear cap-binding protein subunit 1